MSKQVPAMNWPNLVCPDCNAQFKKRDLNTINQGSYSDFVLDFACTSCGNEIHPEDALLRYFANVPTGEIPGRPTKIGGSASIGTKSLEVGKTEEVSLFGGKGLEIDLELLAETDQKPGLSIDDLDGQQIEWFPGPILVEDSVVVDIVQASDAEIGFVTSERKDDLSTVTVAYHYHFHPSGVPQPPWVFYLVMHWKVTIEVTVWRCTHCYFRHSKTF